MAKFSIVQINAEGVRSLPIETTGRIRVVQFGDEKIRVKPKEMVIEVVGADGTVTKTLSINSLPDHREFHLDILDHLIDVNPQVEIDITEK